MTWPFLPAHAVVATVDGRALVYDRVTGSLSALDPVAALVVYERHRFAGIDDATALLHDVLGGEPAAIREQLAALDRALRPPREPRPRPAVFRLPPAQAPPAVPVAFEHRIDCLGTTVLVRCHDPAIAGVVAPLIADHPPAAEAAHVIDVWTADGGIVVARDGETVGAGTDLWAGVSLLDGALTSLVMDADSEHVRVHAGAVVREGRAVVVAGATNQGKTSTVVELTTGGATFVTDEIVELDVRRRTVTGLARAVGLTGPVRERHPALRPAWWDDRWRYPRWPVAPGRLGSTAAGGRLAGIAVLAHDPGHPTVTTPLDPVEALARLCPLVFNRDALAAQLAELGELLAEVPVLLVRHAGAQEAAHAIADWGVL